MVGQFLALMIEGLIRPRQSARWIIGLKLELPQIIMLIVMSYLLTAIMVLGTLNFSGMSVALSILHLFFGGAWGLWILFAAFFAWLPPRIFGGTGEWDQALPAMAWMSVVATLVFPLWIIGVAQWPLEEIGAAMVAENQIEAQRLMIEASQNPLSTLFIFFNQLANIWLFSCVVAEIHGFRTWRVLTTIFGVNLLLMVLF